MFWLCPFIHETQAPGNNLNESDRKSIDYTCPARVAITVASEEALL